MPEDCHQVLGIQGGKVTFQTDTERDRADNKIERDYQAIYIRVPAPEPPVGAIANSNAAVSWELDEFNSDTALEVSWLNRKFIEPVSSTLDLKLQSRHKWMPYREEPNY